MRRTGCVSAVRSRFSESCQVSSPLPGTGCQRVCLPHIGCLPSARLVLSLDTHGAEHRHIGRRRSGGFIPIAAIQTVYGGCPVYYGEGLPGSDNLKNDGSRIAG